MGFLLNKQMNSSTIAKDRLTALLLSERIQCSPDILFMIKNDMVQVANKYVITDHDQVDIAYNQSSMMITVRLPLEHNNILKRNLFTNV